MTKTTRRKKRSFRWLTLVIIGAVVLGAVQMAGRIDRLIDMKNQVAECNVRLAEAQALYDDKMATIDLLDNPAYLERVARENLGMVKQGETLFPWSGAKLRSCRRRTPPRTRKNRIAILKYRFTAVLFLWALAICHVCIYN